MGGTQPAIDGAKEASGGRVGGCDQLEANPGEAVVQYGAGVHHGSKGEKSTEIASRQLAEPDKVVNK